MVVRFNGIPVVKLVKERPGAIAKRYTHDLIVDETGETVHFKSLRPRKSRPEAYTTKKRLHQRLRGALKHTQGTMPVGVRFRTEAEVATALAWLVGKKWNDKIIVTLEEL